MELSYDLAIPLWHRSRENQNLKRYMYPNVHCTLFKIGKTLKQHKYPPTEEGIKWYIHTMEYYPVIIQKEIMPFAATCMDLETVILSEVSQTEKRQISYDNTCMYNLKNGTN